VWLTLASAALAGAWFTWLLVRRTDGLADPTYDQAFFQQVAWSLDHGRGFSSSFTPGSFLGLHLEPLLLLPAALELAWPDPRLLDLLEAAALAALAPAAYLFVRALTASAWTAAAIAAPLPFWPVVQEAARAGFHPESLSSPLALLAGWAGLSGRIAAMWPLAALALLGKEDQGYAVATVGLAVAAFGPRPARRQALALAVLAALWGLLAVTVVMPWLRAGATVDTDSYYRWLAHASPSSWLSALARPEGWLVAAGMVACGGGLGLLRPGWLALALPPLVADLLSAHDPQFHLHLQYGLPLLVPTLVASAAGARALPEANRSASGVLAVTALLPLLLGFTVGRLPPALGASGVEFDRPQAAGVLQRALGAIPLDAAVSADDGTAVFVAGRPQLALLPGGGAAAYVVVDRQAYLHGYVDVAGRRGRLDGLPASGRTLIADSGRFEIWGPVGG